MTDRQTDTMSAPPTKIVGEDVTRCSRYKTVSKYEPTDSY